MNLQQVGKKGLICGLAITMTLGMASPALAAEVKTSPSDYAKIVAQENGISVTTAISNIKGTISTLKINVMQGMVSKTKLETLAQQLYDLEKAVKASNQAPSASVISVLNDAENVVQGVEDNEVVLTAVATVRASLGISALEDTATAQPSMASNIKGFSDVPQSHWGYNAIMDMVGRGLLNGTTSPDANGIAFFDANSAMTKSAYITVAVRVAYQSELDSMPAGAEWWSNAYDIALKHGIITLDDPYMDRENMGDAIKREEMALILVRTAHAKGVATEDLVYPAQISDYTSIDAYYRDAVRECYTLGILNGTGNGFEPQVSLNRVSACQSFYNLLVPEVRKPTTPKNPNGTPSTTNPGITIVDVEAEYSHGGYVIENKGSTKGLIVSDYSRQFETNALSACRFGQDEKGVYVDLAGLKLPDELPEFKYQYVIAADDSDYNMIVKQVENVNQGETKRAYLTEFNNGLGGDVLTSSDKISYAIITIYISGDNGRSMFGRSINTNDKTTAQGTWYDGEVETTPLDSTQVWAGIGK